ncbi:unnamed protein product, partial [Urochloa humidicola]
PSPSLQPLPSEELRERERGGEGKMSSALLRTSARGGRKFGRFVSAARLGGEELAGRPISLWRYPLRRLSSTPVEQLPKGPSPLSAPDEKLNALLENVNAKSDPSLSNNVVVDIVLSSMLARIKCFKKQVSRIWSTGAVLISGGYTGYYISKSVTTQRSKGSLT